MRHLLVCLVLVMSLGCATRKVTVPAGTNVLVPLIEDTTTALSTNFADLDMILKSDLPAESKAKLASELMAKRAELMDKLLARKEKQATNVMTTLHNIGIFITAIIGAKVF